MDIEDMMFIQRRRQGKSISTDGLLHRLREYAQRFDEPNPFKPGDLVTGRQGGLLKDYMTGPPMIVLEVFPTVLADKGDPGTPSYLRRSNMRVARWDRDWDAVNEEVLHSVEVEAWKEEEREEQGAG